jgi:hypothetical protein
MVALIVGVSFTVVTVVVDVQLRQLAIVNAAVCTVLVDGRT